MEMKNLSSCKSVNGNIIYIDGKIFMRARMYAGWNGVEEEYKVKCI